MLINFKVSNFMSFNTECEFNMLAGDWKGHKDHIIKSELGFDGLKSGIIYGANASGKSNFIKAIEFARDFVLEGVNIDSKILRKKYKLIADNINEPSIFDFMFETEGRVFNYRFEVSSKRVEKEWLSEIIDDETEKLLFERKSNESATAKVEFGEGINFDKKDEKEEMRYEIMAENTRPNQLFLTRAIEDNDTKYFKLAYDWFNELIIIFSDSVCEEYEIDISKDKKEELYTKYLKFFDAGIENLILEKSKNYPFNLLDGMNFNPKDIGFIPTENFSIEELTEQGPYYISNHDWNDTIGYDLATFHKSKDGKEDVKFDLSEESDGTIRMIDLIPIFFTIKEEKNAVILIDEIDRSLHPLLVYEFFKLFFKETKNNNSQIIATTHSSHLLDLELFREDEIWFVQKCEGESEMHSLAEFNPETYDQDEIETGYLLGIFGGTPMFRKSALMRDKDE